MQEVTQQEQALAVEYSLQERSATDVEWHAVRGTACAAAEALCLLAGCDGSACCVDVVATGLISVFKHPRQHLHILDRCARL